MSALDPRIAAKLEAFAQRRRRLILFRGACAAVAMLLAAMLLVALIDWLFVLPDGLRWSLSGAAYLSVLVVAWRACGQLLRQAPDARHLARLMEGAAPELREEILSAVELGEGSGEWDSAQFRSLVQRDVSTRLSGLEVSNLLPTALLRSAFALLGVIVALCLVALFLPSLRFGALLVRALLPGANLDRVSAVQVKIIQPSPAERPVAQGDSVPLLVELTGRRVDKAYLETFTKSGGRSVVPLQPTAEGRFTTGIQVAREDVEYRVRAFDAITRKYRLQAAARPSVVRFQKQYRYPAYTGLAPKSVTEESGELSALEGTEVEIAIQPDQPVKSAFLSIEQNHKTQELPLAPRGDGWFSAKLPLTKTFIYRVELVASATGFENKFSPEYEARAVPDLIPEVTMELPQRDFIASANEVLPLAGTAKDDVSLMRVEQQIRINDGKWIARRLSDRKEAETKIDDRWDLFQQGVHPGDIVLTKLVAIDSKGSRGESRPVTITITSAGFERQRQEALAATREVMKAVSTWQDVTAELEKSGRERLRKVLEDVNATPPNRTAAVADFATALGQCQAAAVAAQTKIGAALKLVAPGHETANLVLLSRFLARGQGYLSILSAQLEGAAATSQEAYPREILRDMEAPINSAAKRAKLAEEFFLKLVIGEEIDVACENMEVVAREQEKLTKLGLEGRDDPRVFPLLSARLKVVTAEMSAAEQMMKEGSDYKYAGMGDRLKRLSNTLSEQRAASTPTLTAAHTTSELLVPLLNLAKVCGETWQRTLEMKREIGGHVIGGVQQLVEQAEPAWMNFEKLRPEVEEVQRRDKFPPDLRGRLATARWEARVLAFQTYGDVEELRPDADSSFVRDVRAVQLALEATREDLVTTSEKATREPAWKRVATLDQAFRVLESAHDLTQLATGFDLLADAERYQGTTLRARTANVTDWQRLEQRLRLADNELARTNVTEQSIRKITEETRRRLQQAANDQAMRTLNDEAQKRFQRERVPTEQPAAAEQLAKLVREALQLLQQPVEQAREAIANVAPKLPERMAQLAKEAQQLEAAAQEKAQAAEAAAKDPAQAKTEAREQLAQQQGLNKKLETLKDAIRAEANLQNMQEAAGREKARDADDALALLKDPPVRAEQALQEAAQAERASEQKAAQEAAAFEDGKLAKVLDQLAQHYEAMQKGEEDKSRMALREAEKELGVKDQLDQQYAKAEELAKTAEQPPEGMLAKLEKALEKNPLMRQELSNVSRDLLSEANEKLAAATKQESAVAREVEKLAAQSPPTPKPLTPPPANAAGNPPSPRPTETGENGAQPKADAAAPKSTDPNAPTPPPNSPASDPSQSPLPANSPEQKSPALSLSPKEGQMAANAPDPKASPSPASPSGEQPKPSAPANPQLAQAAEQQKPIAKSAAEAGSAVERAGRHEERLQNKQAGEQLQKLGADLQNTAQQQVPQAAQALATAQAASEATSAVSAAEQGLKEQLARLGDAQGPTARANLPAPAADQPAAANAASPAPADAVSPKMASTPGQSPAPVTSSAPATAAQSSPSPTASAASAPTSATGAAPALSAPSESKATAGNTPPTSPAGAPGASGTPSAPPSVDAGTPSQPGEPGGGLPEIPANTASPQQQIWMARALDALDAALHEGQGQQANQPAQPGQGQPQAGPPQPGQPTPGQGQPQPGQSPSSMQQAQKAMAAASQAQAAEMRASRSSSTPGQPGPDAASQMAKSETGSTPSADGGKGGALPALAAGQTALNGGWGKLPKRMAEQLTQGQRESVSAEYQKEVETYYRVIAERARQNTK